jgi:phosphocarrier protein
MPERIVTVVPTDGLHARPASQFVETATEHEADTQVGLADESLVNAESMLAVTGLGVSAGDEVRIRAEGSDAQSALDDLEQILTTPVSKS